MESQLIKMKSGYVCLGDTQFFPGYSVLFADPAVSSINDLDIQRRTEFLLDMSLLGDAIMAVCKPIRINYAILCNSHPYLHAHAFPRFDWEANEMKKKNPWQYPEEYWRDHPFDEKKHGSMKQELIETLQDFMNKAYQ